MLKIHADNPSKVMNYFGTHRSCYTSCLFTCELRNPTRSGNLIACECIHRERTLQDYHLVPQVNASINNVTAIDFCIKVVVM